MFELYKRNQGRHVRVVTFVAAMVIVLAGAVSLSDKLRIYFGPYLQFGVPTLAAVLIGLLVFRMVNRQRSADFLIATEGEMKKVSWSNRKEIVGSTKVVIITTAILAGLLFGVDVMFVYLFRALGVSG